MINRFSLVFTFLCLVTSPVAAQSVENRVSVPGNYDESLVISVYLDNFESAAGGFRLVAPGQCNYTATITITEPTGLISPIIEPIALVEGQAEHIEVALSQFVFSGPALVIVEVSDVVHNGPCKFSSFGRLTETATGRTQRIISNFIKRRGDQITGSE